MSSRARSSWNVSAAVILAIVGFAGQARSQQSSPDAPPPPASQPALVSGSVTLPYTELKTLLEAAQVKQVPPTPAKPPAPPVAFSVQSARYAMHVEADLRQATTQAVFDVLTFAEGWTAVPLLPTKEIRLAAVTPENALVAVRDGMYTLLLDGPGRRTVTLRFALDSPDGGAPTLRVLRLTGPSALVNELTVSGVPDGWLAEAANATAAPPLATAGQDNANAGSPSVFHLTADQPVVLTLVNAQEQKPAPPPSPSVWQAEAQSLVRYDEGRLIYKTRLRLDADAGSGLTMEFALPTTANLLSVAGDGLERWRVVKIDGGELRHIEVTWKTPDLLRRELMLGYEAAQPSPEGDWHLVSPRITSEAGRLRGVLYALPQIDGMEFIRGDAESALLAGEAQQMPRWLAGEIGGGTFSTVSLTRAVPADNAASLVRARRLPLMRTVRATVEESHFRTRLVADGASLSEGTMSVRHEGPLTFDLTLPKDTQLLACSVDGHDAMPVDRGEGRLDLNLPTSGAGKTKVDLSYTARQAALAPVSGQTALSLPRTELFVQTLLWDLQIPEEYELTAMEGNVTLVPASTSSSNAVAGIHLRKELLKAEQPTAELFYQKRAITP